MRAIFLVLSLVASLIVTSGASFAQTSDPVPAGTDTEAAQTASTDDIAPVVGVPVGPDYVAWDRVAARAQDAIEADRASTVALETLRTQIVDWRTQFQEAQTTNALRIETLKEQLAALGAPPEDGGSEPVEIAARRDALTEDLGFLQAPAVIAQEAFRQADALIRSIDKLIRERNADALLELGPSPLNPALWPTAISRLSTTLRLIWLEVVGTIGQPTQTSQFQEAIPTILFKLALAALLLLRGRPWLLRLNRYVQSRPHIANSALSFLISLGQVALPFIGILLLVSGLYDTEVVGFRADQILTTVPAAALAFLISRWLGGLIFPVFEPEGRDFALSTEQRRRGRWSAMAVGFSYAVLVLLRALADYENYADTTRIVLNFPALVLGALALFALGRLLVTRAKLHDVATGERPYRDRLTLLLGRAIMTIAVLGPVLTAIGYNAVGAALLYPAFQTVGLLAVLFVLQQFVVDVYAIYVRDRAVAQEALIPILIGFALWAMSAPVLALVWGARTSDLMELWIKFRDGFDVGATRIAPTDFLAFAVIFAVGYVITRLIQGSLRNSVLPRTNIDIGGRNAITSFVGYIGIFIAAVVGITAAGIDLSSLAIVAGALSVGIGFGLQNIVSNFVSGIILLIERPISEGDWIEVGGNMGYVRDISVRSTRIETFDRTDVIVPNADLVSGTVVNYTHGKLIGRVIIPVGVAYGTDTRKVEAILREIAEAHPMVLMNPAPGIVFQGFGASSLDFEIRAILRDVNYSLSTKSQINHEIARRFTEEEIEIPFPQQDVWFRNPEKLRDNEEGA